MLYLVVMLIHENVMERGITLASNFCVCGTEAETVRHLFLHVKSQISYGRFFSIKASPGQFLVRLLTPFSAGRRLGLGLRAEEAGLNSSLYLVDHLERKEFQML